MKKKRDEKGKRPPPPKKENIPGCVLRFEKLERSRNVPGRTFAVCCEKAGGQVKYVEFSRETRLDTCGSARPASSRN